mmetsp:Transcript_59579/g.154748  ORF Transcript_59579/g.154748 Transcript_59579/m.154748 type:complete len:290 (+) Transcript_59579:202-1071(+)
MPWFQFLDLAKNTARHVSGALQLDFAKRAVVLCLEQARALNILTLPFSRRHIWSVTDEIVAHHLHTHEDVLQYEKSCEPTESLREGQVGPPVIHLRQQQRCVVDDRDVRQHAENLVPNADAARLRGKRALVGVQKLPGVGPQLGGQPQEAEQRTQGHDRPEEHNEGQREHDLQVVTRGIDALVGQHLALLLQEAQRGCIDWFAILQALFLQLLLLRVHRVLNLQERQHDVQHAEGDVGHEAGHQLLLQVAFATTDLLATDRVKRGLGEGDVIEYVERCDELHEEGLHRL